jgi:hypothetical protein
MSIRAVRWVLENSTSKGAARLVLLALAEHANRDTGEAWPSVATLQREANTSESSVRSALRWARASGEIVKVRTGKKGVSVYRFPGVPTGANPTSEGCSSGPSGVQTLHPASGANPAPKPVNQTEPSQKNGVVPFSLPSTDAERLVHWFRNGLERAGIPGMRESQDAALHHAEELLEEPAGIEDIRKVFNLAIRDKFWASRCTTLEKFATNYPDLCATFISAAERAMCAGCEEMKPVEDMGGELGNICAQCLDEFAGKTNLGEIGS